ncbi:MAG: MurR/RpiR family transcriptional regulator [Desulfobacula sp.]|uniref:MurR/RpiR family transcriptional regulator n=1 Tax=Desulfobacula sp. TaxID=2593537 RepID=UPI001D49F418|nr:MurR/RpiR family transcriptional regulator [Desulfobacula sp.]MBT3806228.1 MurR/RpiR family transcriptional regulator [Desulfobacula sp.]MBT4025325.1 MurR/RpiR family transcriptional regulator [Desulfobacula sp.]MBT4199346.1 MurR/RpiR family transcriptional regulator [Desulfobacula sp.]MBT4507135.1 MurR/RpiR family transcriptional regulator [Desulfobacula sp.]
MDNIHNSLQKIIHEKYGTFAAKGRILAEFVLSSPDKAVFMTTRQLAAVVGVSEATVIRFVRQLGFDSYALFITTLKDIIDRKLTLIERGQLNHPVMESEDKELDRLIRQDIQSINAMHKGIDFTHAKEIKTTLKTAAAVYVMGARLSYAPAYYMGWTLAKIRKTVFILNGSDRTCIDQMVSAPTGSAIVIIATSRYPNELIRMGKIARRQNIKQILITDSPSCPLVQFSEHVLISPQKTIPFLGNPVSLISLIHYLLHTLAADMGDEVKNHQEKLEQAYLENDIWFN